MEGYYFFPHRVVYSRSSSFPPGGGKKTKNKVSDNFNSSLASSVMVMIEVRAKVPKIYS